MAEAVEAEAMAEAEAPPPQSANHPPRGGTGVRLRYDGHLPALSLQDRENSRLILAGKVLLTLHSAVFCKNWHLCGVYWEGCERKRSHVPTPPEVATTVSGLPKATQGEWYTCLHPSGGSPPSPNNPFRYCNEHYR